MYSNDSSRPGESIRDRQLQTEEALRVLSELIARGQLPRELDALAHLAPRPGSVPHVVFHHEDKSDPTRVGRDIKDDAGAYYWSPTAEHVAVLWYENKPSAPDSGRASAVRESPGMGEAGSVRLSIPQEVQDLVIELDRAERSGMPYVVLKWFRDTCLPASGRAWADGPAARHRSVSDAIEGGLLLTSKVSNPKNPAFPPTTVRLNRTSPAVIEILRSVLPPPEFRPIPIQGEPLSDMIIRERRE